MWQCTAYGNAVLVSRKCSITMQSPHLIIVNPTRSSFLKPLAVRSRWSLAQKLSVCRMCIEPESLSGGATQVLRCWAADCEEWSVKHELPSADSYSCLSLPSWPELVTFVIPKGLCALRGLLLVARMIRFKCSILHAHCTLSDFFLVAKAKR